MGKKKIKKLEKRINEISAALEMISLPCNRCENYKPRTIEWSRWKKFPPIAEKQIELAADEAMEEKVQQQMASK